MRPSTRCLLALLACVAGVSAQTAGRVSAVRVYRGQALVTRTVEFTAQAGPQELVVGELPERLLPESLYATGDGGLVVRAVRYRAEAVAEEPREEVRLLDQEIAAKQDEIERIRAERDVLEQQGKYLDKLENFVAPTASAELSKGVLDAEALMKMTQFAFEQRAQIATKRLEYGRQEKQAQEALTVLGRKRQALVGSDSRLRRQAVVFLEAPKAGPARLDLNYLVSGVGWSPAYVARLNGAMDKLMLEYHAVVTQFSGEDWTNVELVLSTGSVAMQANTPMLAPLYVGLTEAGGDGADDAREYAAQRRELEEQIRGT
ncbi:MAG: mucoidy inhibitor MuiA family protein, partial [Armatimonadetes bacterium]|nr:mucoidy inhibitor MuiA family protein [Armatimonadota bacterium]